MQETLNTFTKIVSQLDPQKRENLSGDIASVTNALKTHTEPEFSLTFSTESGFVTAVNSLLKTNFTEAKSATAYVNNRQGGSIFGKMVATGMTKINSDASLEKLVSTYIDAASELKSAQSKLGNTHDETFAFIAARDALREHPEFPGTLPKTFFSGGSLDPEGVDGNGSDGNDQPKARRPRP